MSVYRPAGRANYTVEVWIQGHRFRRGTRSPARKVALELERRWRAEWALELAEGRAGAGRKRPLGLAEAAARYLLEVAAHQPTAADQARKLDRLLANLCALEGISRTTPLSAIDDDLVARLVARRRGQPARRKATLVAPATVNRDTVEPLRRLLRRAGRVWNAQLGAPIDWAAHRLREPDGRVRELRGDEEIRLMGALRPDHRPLFAFLLRSGMRLGNARRLTWAEVDLEAARIAYRVKSRRHHGGRAVALPITPALAAILGACRGRHPVFVFTYACARSRGKRRRGERYPFSANGWRKAWAAALAEAGLEDLRVHDLRHDKASKALRASGNLAAVQAMLGHADVASTLRYAHVMDDDVRAVMVASEGEIGDQGSGMRDRKGRRG